MADGITIRYAQTKVEFLTQKCIRIAFWDAFGKFANYKTPFFKAKSLYVDQYGDIRKNIYFQKKSEIYFPVSTGRFNVFYFVFFNL